MMYTQARLHQEDSYEYQQGYESQRGCYNDHYSDPYGYGDRTSQEQYQPRRPLSRIYDDKAHDEYDDPPESYQESYYGHDYEHSRRIQPLRRDTSYDHSREYRTPRYYPDSYEEDYHDQEDYYYEHRRDKRSDSYQSYKSQSYPSSHYDEDDDYLPQREFTNSQSYDSYPTQAYSPQSYTQNTPPSKKKSIAEHMYEHWLEPKPKDPNDPYKTFEERMFENMKLQVICYVCKGPHYRYQCQEYPLGGCKAKFSHECRGKQHWEDESDQRLGTNIVPNDGMEDDSRVTPRVDQCVVDYGKQISFEVPLEGIIEDAKESEQEKGNPDGGNGNEFQNEVNEEELPLGETLEAQCGKTPNSTCVSTTLGKNCAKSWADMCEEDHCDAMGMPNCVDNCNIDNVENAFVEHSCDDDSLTLVDNSLTSKHDGDIHEVFYFDDENNGDNSLIEAKKVEFSDFFDTHLDEALLVHDMIGEMVDDEENVKVDTLEEGECERKEVEEDKVNIGSIVEIEDVLEKNITLEEANCKINIEEKGREDEEVKENEKEEGEKMKEEPKKAFEDYGIFLDVVHCLPFEENMPILLFTEFANARHLRAYLEEKVDGEKGLAPVQVCLSDGSKVASGQGR